MYFCAITNVDCNSHLSSFEGTKSKVESVVNFACFSYDLRGENKDKPLHWKGEHPDERAFFRTAKEPASLNIDLVDEKDEGEYMCNVDFGKSPTRKSRIQLDIISKLRILQNSTISNLFDIYFHLCMSTFDGESGIVNLTF